MTLPNSERNSAIFDQFLDGVSLTTLGQSFGLTASRISAIVRQVAQQRNREFYRGCWDYVGSPNCFVLDHADQFATPQYLQRKIERSRMDKLHTLGPELHAALVAVMDAAPPELVDSGAGQEALRALRRAAAPCTADA